MTDYVIVNENCNKMVKEFKVGGGGVDSDHMPLMVDMFEDRRLRVKE